MILKIIKSLESDGTNILAGDISSYMDKNDLSLSRGFIYQVNQMIYHHYFHLKPNLQHISQKIFQVLQYLSLTTQVRHIPDPKVTSNGPASLSVVQLPSCPLLLSPQHLTSPPLTSAHEWEAPKAMAKALTPAEDWVRKLVNWAEQNLNVSAMKLGSRDLKCAFFSRDADNLRTTKPN